jgi:hypothetical protein
MDVLGNAPTAKAGRYFRNNLWWWRPLWAYCCEVYPPCCEVNGHTNDGDGLDAERAAELSVTLRGEVDAGHTAAYAAIRQAEIDAMPNTPCDLCEGTGRRLVSTDGPGAVPLPRDSPVGVWIACNGCQGTGSTKPWAALYCFDVENVREFAEFCAASGGFRIC